MIKYVIISNWSSKDQPALHTQSEADGIGVAQAVESLTGDLALLKLDESHFESGGQFFEDADYECFTKEEISDEIDTLVWTDTPSEGGEI